MLKTISAVLLAASVLAAPALAASGSKTDAAAVNRTASVKSASKIGQKPFAFSTKRG